MKPERDGEVKMGEMSIYQYLDKLTYQPIQKLGRDSNMLWLRFGNETQEKDVAGEWISNAAYMLQIQTMWRIVNREKKKILFASSDIYLPKTNVDPVEEFDWEQQGNTLFDEKSEKWLYQMNPIYVEEYKVNRWGDLLLVFSNNERLEVYVDASGNTECWRLFKVGCDELHLVVTGLGVSFE